MASTVHVICGLPRSGSTLLCNILNQNPALLATDTSPVPGMLGTLSQHVSASEEIKGHLAADDETTNSKLSGVFRSVVEAWYEDEDRIIFDKSRSWATLGLLMASMFPDVRFIIPVRDLRNVFASVEKQHRVNPWFDLGAGTVARTVTGRAEMMVNGEGFIGASVVSTLDLIARMPERCHVINYETLTRDPAGTLADLYESCELDPFKHDFDNVANVSREPDHLSLGKFPHEGSGPVLKTDRHEHTKWLPAELSSWIFAQWPGFNQAFGYQ